MSRTTDLINADDVITRIKPLIDNGAPLDDVIRCVLTAINDQMRADLDRVSATIVFGAPGSAPDLGPLCLICGLPRNDIAHTSGSDPCRGRYSREHRHSH